MIWNSFVNLFRWILKNLYKFLLVSAWGTIFKYIFELAFTCIKVFLLIIFLKILEDIMLLNIWIVYFLIIITMTLSTLSNFFLSIPLMRLFSIVKRGGFFMMSFFFLESLFRFMVIITFCVINLLNLLLLLFL